MTIRETAAVILKKRPAYENIIDFYLQIFMLQEESGKTTKIEPMEMGENILRAKLDAGLHLIELTDFKIDRKASESLFEKLGKIGGNETLTHAFGKMADAIDNGRLETATLFSAILEGNQAFFNDLGESLEIDPAIPRFATYHSIKPSILLLAEHLSGHLKNENREFGGCCPVCGSRPSFSLLRDEGNRELICGFCEHTWPTRRLFCPFCGNTEQKKLSYAYSEEEDHYRIDICEGCRKYIKMADLRKLPYPFHAGLEQISTLHLDMIARREGYEAGSDDFIGLE